MLLSSKPVSHNTGLLLLRAAAGGLMLTHGWPKLMSYSEGLSKFPDPIGLGSEVSLTLVVFAEVVCSILVLVGLYTRLALIPAIINMLVAVFVVHGDDPIGKKELGLLYLISYVVLFLTGPGSYSADARMRRR